MAHKLAVITDASDPGAWIVARGINEVAKRHAGNIDVDYIDKINLASLKDGEMLYVMGHGSPVDIHGGYDGKKVAETLVNRGLPKGKKIRIRLLSCETGMYSSKATLLTLGTERVKVRESLTRDLKNALTFRKYHSCTLEVPLGNVVVLSAKEGDNAILPARSAEAIKECGRMVTADPRLKAVGRNVRLAIQGGTPLGLLGKTFAAVPAIVDFFAKWNPYIKHRVYKGVEGWRIVST